MIDFTKYLKIEPDGIRVYSDLFNDPEWLQRPMPKGLAMIEAMGFYVARPDMWDADALADRWGWPDVADVEAMMEFVENEQRVRPVRQGVDRE